MFDLGTIIAVNKQHEDGEAVGFDRLDRETRESHEERAFTRRLALFARDSWGTTSPAAMRAARRAFAIRGVK